MKKTSLSVLALTLSASAAFAGGMGELPPSKLLFLEAGLSYSHSFYKDSVVTPESYTLVTPNGYSMDPSNFFPNNFWGGYIGASWFSNYWMLNTRLDMYGKKERYNADAETRINMAPVRLSFTADRVWGDINAFSYGLGAGAVIESVNNGAMIVPAHATNPPSETIDTTRIDPMIEGFLMYRMANNLGIKFNVAYQIPLNSQMGNGDLNLNLGLNYAFNV